MEACRQASLRNNAMTLYDGLRETPSSMAMPCLYVRLFLETLLFNCSSNTAGSSNETRVVRDWQVEQRCTADHILRNLVLSRLEQWKDTVEGVELPVLLMCDWLAATFPEEQILELVASMYRRCGEENLAEVTKSQHLVLKPQSNHINNCQSKRTKMEIQSRLEEICKEPAKELQGSINCSQRAAENGDVSLNGVTAKDSTVINTVELGSTAASNERVDNVRVVERRNGSTSDELLEVKCTPKLSPVGAGPAPPPPRETCVVCGSAVPLSPKNLLSSTCANGHTWQRCCVSFLLCSDYEYRRCQTCSRCVCLPTKGLSPLLQAALRSTRNCPFCTGWFT